MKQELKQELSKLMHEMIYKNKEIFEIGDYQILSSMCEQDIAIIASIGAKSEITAKEISVMLQVPKTTIVSAVARLEERKYVRKVENVKDRREKFLVLTEKGQAVNQAHEGYESAILEALANLWKKEEQEKLVVLLRSRKELM